MYKKKYYRINIYPFTNTNETYKLTKYCEWIGCNLKGEYPAPSSREKLRNFKWFCLGHVKKYNKSWDYFKGRSSEQIEDEISGDQTWHRPTWKNTKDIYLNGFDNLRDYYNFSDCTDKKSFNSDDKKVFINISSNVVENALRVFDLNKKSTAQEIKDKYKFLVKKFHPDANKGNKIFMEKLIKLNEAYNILINIFKN